MIRGTTPTLTLTIPNFDITGTNVFVTLCQGSKLITKSGDEVSVSADQEASTIAVFLTQKETLSLQKGKSEIQVRFITSEGIAYATNIKSVTVDRVLLQKVISYGGEDDV